MLSIWESNTNLCTINLLTTINKLQYYRKGMMNLRFCSRFRYHSFRFRTTFSPDSYSDPGPDLDLDPDLDIDSDPVPGPGRGQISDLGPG